jgi:hypothetical protein
MKLKSLFLITSILFILSAVITLFIPATQLTLYGLNTGLDTSYMAQWAGLGSVVIALITFFSRNLGNSEGRQIILLTLIIYFILGISLSVYGIYTGLIGISGWYLLVMFALFFAGYLYFFFKKE